MTEQHIDPSIQPFVRDGRIERFPKKQERKILLLGWAAAEVLAPNEVIDEPEINARLARLTDDVALLRRYLVDYGFVDRAADGGRYVRMAITGPIA